MVKRDIATPLTIGAFLLMAVTGILMFFHWDTGFNKLAHEWLGWLFVVAVGLHMAVNFKAFKNYFKKPTAKLIMGTLVAILALTFLPQSILGNREGNKRPPMQQAVQVLNNGDVATLAQLTHITPEALKAKLASNGFTNVTDNQTLAQIAGNDRDKQNQLLTIVLSDSQSTTKRQ